MTATATRTRVAVARYATPRRPERETLGPRVAAVMKELGHEPMPWQQQVLDVKGELFTAAECKRHGVAEGSPAYRELALGVPRRAGKTTLSLASMVDRCTLWPHWNNERPKAIYTAQDGTSARKKFIRDMAPLLEGSRSPAIRRRVAGISKGMGNESARFTSGGLIVLGSSSEASGHGEGYDEGVIDEAFHDKDRRREAAIAPAQATMDWAQRLITSTAGTASSLYWNTKCEAGRRAVEADSGHGLSYFEWSADPDSDIHDETQWPEFHPALGHTISLAVMRFEIANLEDDMEALRAWGNVPTERVFSQQIDGAAWDAVNGDHSAKGKGPHVWAVDVAHDRSMTAVASCDLASATVALTDYHPGTQWVVERVTERLKDHPGTVVYDATGPASNLGRDQKGWVGLDSAAMTQSFSDFYDAVIGETIKIRRSDHTNKALAGAEVRRSADSQKWSRSMSVTDVSPLVAVTMAATQQPKPKRRQKPFSMS